MGVLQNDISATFQAYEEAHADGECLCTACSGFGQVYSVLSPCEVEQRSAAHGAAIPAAQGAATPSDDMPTWDVFS